MKFDFQAIDFQAIGFKAVARRVATPLLALAICASAPAARAADRRGGGGPFAGDAPATFAASDVPQTYGTGWYIRGDADFGVGSITRVGGDGSGKISGSGLGGDVGFGYQYGNYLRVDWDFGGVQTKTSSFAGGASTAVTCVSALTAGPTAGSYVWAATGGTCTPQGGSSFGRLHTLLNGYVDLGDWWGVTPYVGAGAGIARLQGSYWQNYYTAAGAAYAANLTAAAGSTWYDPGCACTVNPVVPGTTTPVAFGPQNWYTAKSTTKFNFAWDLMAGVTYDFSRNAKLDVGVRYLNLGTFPVPPTIAHPGGSQATVDDKEVRVGFRYLID